MAERRCIVTGDHGDPASGEMIRFVCGPDGSAVPDLKGNLPGRGAWVKTHRATLEQAIAKRAFSRGFKKQIAVADNLPHMVDALLETRALDALGFARKAGECIAGSGKVDSLIRNDKALALLHATDGADDGLRKLRQAIFSTTGEEDGIPLIRAFTADQMSLALGATHVIHAAMTTGGAAKNALSRIRQLERYRAE
ncbi:transcription terminating nucleic-acid-binding protein [Ahrensia sp. R2A130]|nr:transcription terminating nucleic-acid-binding protein [Ahrensia sp. R2A130]